MLSYITSNLDGKRLRVSRPRPLTAGRPAAAAGVVLDVRDRRAPQRREVVTRPGPTRPGPARLVRFGPDRSGPARSGPPRCRPGPVTPSRMGSSIAAMRRLGRPGPACAGRAGPTLAAGGRGGALPRRGPGELTEPDGAAPGPHPGARQGRAPGRAAAAWLRPLQGVMAVWWRG